MTSKIRAACKDLVPDNTEQRQLLGEYAGAVVLRSLRHATRTATSSGYRPHVCHIF